MTESGPGPMRTASALFTLGFLSLFAQVTLIRELAVATYGNDLIYALALGSWLLWTAVGVLIGGWTFPSLQERRAPAAGTRAPTPHRLAIAWIAFAPTLLASLVFLRRSHDLLGGVPGAYLPFPLQLASVALGLLPVSLLLGVLFQWVTRAYVDSGRTLAGAYGIESAGAALGGVCATVAMSWNLPVLVQALLSGLIATLFVPAAGHGQRRGALRHHSALGGPPRSRARTASSWRGVETPFALVIGTLLLLALVWSRSLDSAMTSWTHPHLVATADTPYGRVSVESVSGQTVVFQNNALTYETEGTGAEEFVHLAALQVATPRRVLIIGGGAEGLLREAAKHRPESVVYVDVDGRLVDLVRPFLPETDRNALDAATVEIAVADPRRFLSAAGRFDLVLVGMPEPTSGQSGRYYTREFFRQCADHLEPEGVVALRLPSSENLWTHHLVLRTASIYNALRSELAHVLLLPGGTSYLLGSERPLLRSPGVLAERLVARGIETSLVGPQYLEYIYSNDRLPEVEALMEGAPGVLHSDLRPIGYSYSQMLWLSQFFPALATLDPTPMESWTGPASLPRWGLTWAALTGLFLLLRRRRLARRATLVGAAGLIGIVLESVLILNYQAQRGVLFRDLGILLTVFMLGLSLGSLLLRGLALRRGERSLSRLRWAIPGSLVLLPLLVGWVVATKAGADLVTTAALLLLTGAGLGGLLAHQSLEGSPPQGSVIAPLYGADLIGGALGSVLAALFLLPVLGLDLSACAMSAVATSALLLVVRN